MRIERTGKVEPLTPRVTKFMVEALGGKSLDDRQSSQETRADYACLNGLLAVEVKSLEDAGSVRMDNLTDELRQRDDWPIFLGSAPMESFIKNMSDPEGIRTRLIERVGRAILNHLKKANQQLKAHADNFPRKNLMRLMLLINEDNEVYDPHTVAYIVWHALRRRRPDGSLLYRHVDAVHYMTERHAGVVDQLVALPSITIESPTIAGADWKLLVMERFVTGWTDWNGIPLYRFDRAPETVTIDHIPETAPRHERWRTDYRRNPYMNGFSDEQIRERFDECIVMTLLETVIGSPYKPTEQVSMQNIILFTHLMMELAKRAIPTTAIQRSLERDLAAARRLNLGTDVEQWLRSFDEQVRNHGAR